MNKKVLLVQDVDRAGKDLLLAEGYELVLAPSEDKKVLQELVENCDAAFSKTCFLDEEILRAAKNLKVVAKHGVGIDNVIDLDTATRLGIFVVNTPFANVNAVAEHTIAGMLAFSQKMIQMHNAAKHADFNAPECGGMHEISGKTVGIIGLGNIGKRVAEIAAKGFRMNVLGYDPYIKKESLPDYIEYVNDIGYIYETCDFITLHLGASPETNGMVKLEQFKRMKKEAVFLNFARGSLVVEKDLLTALQTGEIAGAVLDVFAQEPVQPENPLLLEDNILLSPHSAALTDEALRNMSLQGAQGIIDILEGKQPTWCLNYDKVKKNTEKYVGENNGRI